MAGALTGPEFARAAARFPRLSDKAKQVARAVLVDGRSFEQVCEQFQTSRQLAHQWATKIFDEFQPTGWVTETVTLPLERMRDVREMERDARRRWAEQLPPAKVTRR